MSRTTRTHEIILITAFVLFLAGCATQPTPARATFSRIDAGPLTSRELATASASWVDADQDGDADLYVVNGYATVNGETVPHPNFFYQNEGDGTFTERSDHPLSGGAVTSGNSTWADYDNDGDLDVFIANQGGVDNQLFIAGPDGSYMEAGPEIISADGGRSFSSTWVDLDNDGWLDLFVSNGGVSRVPEPDFVYRNTGDGRFERLEQTALTQDTLVSAGAAWGDLDLDGDQDLFLPLLQYSPHPVFRNDGSFLFVDITAELALSPHPLTFEPSGEVASLVDVDNDLDLDLFRGTSGGFVDLVYKNTGSGAFEPMDAGALGSDGISSTDAAWGDYDNDGDLDVIIAPWGGAAVFYENDGSGRFRRAPAGSLGLQPNFTSGVSAEDYDNDGDLDLLITHWHGGGAAEERNQLYRNDLDGGNWAAFRLEGVESNRSAIGARLELTATIRGVERTQMRHVQGKTNWRNSSSHTQHFGLGDAAAITALKIIWPSGQVDTLTEDLEINTVMAVREGVGILTSLATQ